MTEYTLIQRILPFVFAFTFTGCATFSETESARDPLESYNRVIFDFNDGFDRYFLKPVSQGYDAISPEPVQKGVYNFFSNIDDIVVIVNDILQLKPAQLASDMGRLLINTSLGLAGFIDWASDMNLPKHHEDFGQTLGYWGVPPGPYLVIPFWGPSTFRDGTGLLVDSAAFDPVWQKVEAGFPMQRRPAKISWGLTLIDTISLRASFLQAEKILDEAALDRYSFIREAYLQRRLNLVYDGSPPEEEPEFNEEELFDY